MKLVRFDNGRTGLLVNAPQGPLVIDILSSLGAFGPAEPTSNGILKGVVLENKVTWCALIEHLQHVEIGCNQLSGAAASGRLAGLVFHHSYALGISSGAGTRDGIPETAEENQCAFTTIGPRKTPPQAIEPAVCSEECAPIPPESNVVSLDVVRRPRKSSCK
jgi:hypothetical protein